MIPESDDEPSRETLLERILRAERAGDPLMAADQAGQALQRFPDDVELRYHHLLSLARAGALTEAEKLWPRYALPQDSVNYAALGARLLRERAFKAGEGAAPLLAAAAEAYAAIFRRSQNSFPGINAAVLHALAGNLPRAQEVARAVLALTQGQVPADRDARFNLAADRLQTALILDDRAEAETAIATLLANVANKALAVSTRRQLLRLAAALGRGQDLADRLKPGPALHYSGHLQTPAGEEGRFPAAAEAAVKADIEAALGRLQPGAGFGSLASGGDILIAEALLRRGADLTVVLPFDVEIFIAVSVLPAGKTWVERFHAVLAKAGNVVMAAEGAYHGDDQVFAYCSRLAMGLARLRAAIEQGEVHQLAVWDGQPGNGVAGTAADLEIWAKLGLPATLIDSRPTGTRAKAPWRDEEPFRREVRAFLFGDFRGFSKLSEQELLIYNSEILPAAARVLDRFGSQVEIRQTWGDGLYLVFASVAVAAVCALDLQTAFAELDYAKLHLPSDLGLRAALHAGPVSPVYDAVMRQPAYTGRHISRAARMEPVTPEGQVYVSEAFAALLALEAAVPVAYEYVGRVPLAKAAGYLRMYLLTPQPKPAG